MSEEFDLYGSFIEEANEVLAEVENDFLEIEEAGKNFDTELVNKVFRGIHSMKGSSGFLGLTSIGSLAHEMENVLNLIRNNELVPTSAIIDPLLKGADVLRNMIADVTNSNEIDVSNEIQALKQAISGQASAETQESLNRDVDVSHPNGGLAFVMIKELELVSRQNQGMHVYLLEIDMIQDLEDKNRKPLDFLKELYSQGELVESYLSTAGMGTLSSSLPDSMTLMLLYASKWKRDNLAETLKLDKDKINLIASADQKNWIKEESPSNTTVPESTPAEATIKEDSVEVQAAPEAPEKPQAASPAGDVAKSTAPAAPTSLRVNVKVLDTLMNLAGELVLGRNQMIQIASTKDHSGFDSVAAKIDQVTSELQEAIMQTRMQPIGSVFSKFPRIVRDLSSKLNKKCDLEIEGKDVELDKTIIEGIGDPLTHLIRNSVDHGVELPSVRKERQKSETGTIHLKAYHQAGKVNIAIIDDGGGIDAEKMKTKAVEKGVITTDQAEEMSDRDAVRLIFHPGFSTAEKVTDVSGRGVGMDVVRTNIENLGGTVDIETAPGKGTEIIVKLPLTLAIIPSLVVRGGEDRFAIPQVNISELVRIKSSEVSEKIERVKNAEVLRLRGRLLPLLRMNQVLDNKSMFADPETNQLQVNNRQQVDDRRENQPVDEDIVEMRSGEDRRNNTTAGALNIIVVESEHLKYGLIVDELFDSKEIVVKPLGKHLKDAQCLAGATILGDGQVAMILDVAGIAGYMKLAAIEEHHIEQEVSEDQTDETQSTMIFSYASDEHFSIPVSFVARIERIQEKQIDSVGGQEVLQYRGTSLPLLSLDKYIKAKPRPESTSLYVIVFKIGDQEVGLIAPELVDIHEIPVDIDTKTFRENGVVGSTIINEKAVRVIDVYEISKEAFPEWEQQEMIQAKEDDSHPKVLLAEDSSFFRQQMVNFLESVGYEVTGCEDGQVAWETLQDPDQKFDIIVTDVEMPNMDGLQFTNKVKTDPCFAHIPVVAVTSLAGQEDQKRGKEAGVDEYQVKLDRDQLLESIKRLLKQSKHNAGLSQVNQTVS